MGAEIFWVARALRTDEAAMSAKPENLKGNIQKELKLLRKIAKQRTLYPEEKYLKDRLTQYQKSLKAKETNE